MEIPETLAITDGKLLYQGFFCYIRWKKLTTMLLRMKICYNEGFPVLFFVQYI